MPTSFRYSASAGMNSEVWPSTSTTGWSRPARTSAEGEILIDPHSSGVRTAECFLLRRGPNPGSSPAPRLRGAYGDGQRKVAGAVSSDNSSGAQVGDVVLCQPQPTGEHPVGVLPQQG